MHITANQFCHGATVYHTLTTWVKSARSVCSLRSFSTFQAAQGRHCANDLACTKRKASFELLSEAMHVAELQRKLNMRIMCKQPNVINQKID